jgi:hypothetical protein
MKVAKRKKSPKGTARTANKKPASKKATKKKTTKKKATKKKATKKKATKKKATKKKATPRTAHLKVPSKPRKGAAQQKTRKPRRGAKKATKRSPKRPKRKAVATKSEKVITVSMDSLLKGLAPDQDPDQARPVRMTGDPLLDILIAGDVLNEDMAEWAQAHQAEHGVPLDTALLELDLIDEAELLNGLESCLGMTTARPHDLLRLDPEVAKTLPESFSSSFSLSPLRLHGKELVALVVSPLDEGSLEDLHNLFGLEVRQLAAPSHFLALARDKLYGTGIDERSRTLEARLAQRRAAPDMQRVLANVLQAATLNSAIADLLDFAAHLLEFVCIMVGREGELRVAAVRTAKGAAHQKVLHKPLQQTPRGGQPPSKSLALPGPGCSLAAAFRQGGYFVGPLEGTGADQVFYRALERPPPRWAFLAPIPTAGDSQVFFYADNGPRGIATRWVAELTLLTSRLGQRGGDREEQSSVTSVDEAFQRLFDRQEAPRIVSSGTSGPPAALTNAEQTALDRLRQAAAEAGCEIDLFVDQLLDKRNIRPVPEDATTLVGEVKDLFDKLTTDIPAQLARGMETAFREMVPRLAAAPPAGSRPATGAGIVRKEEAGPREVPSYRSKRRKTKRVKL